MTNRQFKGSFLYLLAAMVFIASCSGNTVSQMTKAGHAPLDAKSIDTLFSGQTLHFEAHDFNANLTFHEEGTLSARNTSHETDNGTWELTAEDMLCLRFKTWYFGDTKCYIIFQENDAERYTLFTANGARYYTVRPVNASKVGSLDTEIQPKSNVTYRDTTDNSPNIQYESPQAGPRSYSQPDSGEMKFLLATTARNCPACDLSGLDLSETNLVDAILSNATLSGTNFHSADLRRANLSGADLEGADLSGANLSRAKLKNCNLRKANLSGANLTMTDFTGADLTGTILQGTPLDRTTGTH